MEAIQVEPLEGGWAVITDATDNPMIFRSGRDAESSARVLAERVARQGEAVRLQLRLRHSGKTVRMVALPPLTESGTVRLVQLPDPASSAAFD